MPAGVPSRTPRTQQNEFSRARRPSSAANGRPEQNDCAICTQPMHDSAQGQPVWENPPCGHRFHRTCIAEWLKRQQTCPLCRATVASCPGVKRPSRAAATRTIANSSAATPHYLDESMQDGDRSVAFAERAYAAAVTRASASGVRPVRRYIPPSPPGIFGGC